MTELVSSRISQRANFYERTDVLVGVEVFRRDVRVVRKFRKMQSRPTGGGKRGAVQAFSAAARRRLRFAASNSSDDLRSQFGLTYHNTNPSGADVKRHLNAFLTAVRRKLGRVSYLWILEFQRRGVPHFHLFLAVDVSPELGAWLGATWNRVTGESPEHLQVHQHARNFIRWDMGAAGYLTKYLDKEAQKAVPEGFGWTGRFWGASQGLVGAPVSFSDSDLRDLPPLDGDPLLTTLRTLSRFQRAQWRRFGRRGRTLMQRDTSFQVSGGSAVFWRLLDYYEQQARGPDFPLRAFGAAPES